MPAVYQLLGFPGTGKYTIARAMVEELAARGEPAALLDNHATANLVWALVEDERRFEPDVMARMNELRRVLVESAAELTGPRHSIVFTNFVRRGVDVTVLEPHRRLAARLGRPFVPVVLHGDRDEILRRIPNPDRAERMKLVDPTWAAKVMDAGMARPDWPELVDLDVTGLSPRDAARRVLELSPPAT